MSVDHSRRDVIMLPRGFLYGAEVKSLECPVWSAENVLFPGRIAAMEMSFVGRHLLDSTYRGAMGPDNPHL